MIQTKRLATSPTHYIEVPVAQKPASVSTDDYQRLAAINDYIIERVSYDFARAGDPKASVVQSPSETLRRGKGVCRDYAALFEALATKDGYRVRSLSSDALDHAWNQVQLGGFWWLIDVTWNDGELLASGRQLPHHVKQDADFRRRFFLIDGPTEKSYVRHGLISDHHNVPDIHAVNFTQTLAALPMIADLERMNAQLTRMIEARNGYAQRSHSSLVERYNALVHKFNRCATAAAQRPLRPQLDALSQQLEASSAKVSQADAAIAALRKRRDAKYQQFQALASKYPLAVRYSLVAAGT